jgi:alpha-1,2-mannosyltransferase
MKDARRLFGAFGIVGLLVWPVVLWLASQFFTHDLTVGQGIHINGSTLVGRDFVNVWEGGRLAGRGDVATVYDRPAYRTVLKDDVDIEGIYAFSYPPHMLAMTVPFGQFSYAAALALWTLAGLALFWHAARPWLRDVGLPSWAIVLLPGGLVNIWAGHFGFLIGALALYGWRFAETRPRLSGAAFALMTVKPHMGVLVPLLLMLKRQWATIVAAAIGTLGLVALSILLFGIDPWTTWLTSTLPFQASLIGLAEPGMGFLYMMPTVERMMAPFTDQSAIVLGVQLMVGAATLAVLVRAWRQGVALADLGLLSLIAIVLILPYSFIYDMVAAGLATLVLAARWRDRLSAVEKWVFGIAFMVPLIQSPTSQMGVPFAPVALFALLWIAAREMAADARGLTDPADPAGAAATRSA